MSRSCERGEVRRSHALAGIRRPRDVPDTIGQNVRPPDAGARPSRSRPGRLVNIPGQVHRRGRARRPAAPSRPAPAEPVAACSRRTRRGLLPPNPSARSRTRPSWMRRRAFARGVAGNTALLAWVLWGERLAAGERFTRVTHCTRGVARRTGYHAEGRGSFACFSPTAL
jgi:hypothetical protein